MADDENPLEDRPGAILFKADPTGETSIRAEWVADLSQADYERFNQALNALSDIHVTNMFAYVRQSALDMFGRAQEAYEAFRDGNVSTLQPDDTYEWEIRLLTAVLDVCSTIHHHEEQSRKAAEQKFGSDSQALTDVRAEFTKLRADCFGYRYLSRPLRNVMVHSTMRAVRIDAEAHWNKGDPIAFVDLIMDRSALIEEKRHVNAGLRAELAALPDDPSIYQMVVEAVPALLKTNRRIVEILHPEIGEICGTVVEFDRLFGGQDGVRAISRNRSRELRRPFKFAYYPVAGRVIMAARRYFETNETGA